VRVRFGATIIQVVAFPDLRDDFQFAESIGLDNAWVIDQFRIDGAPEMPLLEAWTTLAAVAVATNRIRLGTLVTNVAMRNPAVLAKSILTVDQVSNGRLEVAVGAGYYQTEHEALGVDFIDPAGRSGRLREVVEALDRALRGDTVTIEGEHVRLTEAMFRPHPTQQPRPPLWVAAQARAALQTAATYADAVVTLGEHGAGIDRSLAAFQERMERLDEMCASTGREPSTLRRCYYAGWADEPIFSSPAYAADLIGRYAEAGATDFTFFLSNPNDESLRDLASAGRAGTRDHFELLSTEVFPAFRD
jgi:alkanesulfonate monooxygenase SsuD/methylene tetrahydromethanopterin reductase-like flavin-dependent oxidoreductase (luciferase family)